MSDKCRRLALIFKDLPESTADKINTFRPVCSGAPIGINPPRFELSPLSSGSSCLHMRNFLEKLDWRERAESILTHLWRSVTCLAPEAEGGLFPITHICVSTQSRLQPDISAVSDTAVLAVWTARSGEASIQRVIQMRPFG